jgi:hypothetical protein
MMTGFMEGHQANGAFVACGPPGFTAIALINLGARSREMYVLISVLALTEYMTYVFHSLKYHGLASELAGEVWYASSVLAAMMLFGQSFRYFLRISLCT